MLYTNLNLLMTSLSHMEGLLLQVRFILKLNLVLSFRTALAHGHICSSFGFFAHLEGLGNGWRYSSNYTGKTN